MGIRIKDANNLKVSENVFDEVTLLAFTSSSIRNGSLRSAVPSVPGKRPTSFWGTGTMQAVAIKIYRIQSANFTTMSSYVTGDCRFSHVKKSKKESHLCVDKKRVL